LKNSLLPLAPAARVSDIGAVISQINVMKDTAERQWQTYAVVDPR
jgi:hypothetical protein